MKRPIATVAALAMILGLAAVTAVPASAAPPAEFERSADAMAVWKAPDGLHYSLYGHGPDTPVPVGTHFRDEAWWAPGGGLHGRIAGTTASDADPDIAFDHMGNATAVWHRGGASSQILSARFDANTRLWQPVQPVATGDRLSRPTVALDSAGRALAVWMDDEFVEHTDADGNPVFHGHSRLRFSIWTGGAWSAPASVVPEYAGDPSLVPAAGRYAGLHVAVAFLATSATPRAGATTAEEALVVWQDASAYDEIGHPTGLRVFSAHWSGRTFDALTQVGPTSRYSGHRTELTPDPDGGATLQTDVIGSDVIPAVYSARYVSGVWSAFGETQRFASGPAVAALQPATPTGPGSDIAIWEFGGALGWSRHSGTSWGAPAMLASSGKLPEVAGIAHGRAAAVWADDQGEYGPNDEVVAAGFDGTSWTTTVLESGVPMYFSPAVAAVTGSPTLPHARWTVGVYISNDLAAGDFLPAGADLLEMLGAPSTAVVNVALLYDPATTDPNMTMCRPDAAPGVCVVTHGGIRNLSGAFERSFGTSLFSGVNMGDPQTLRRFTAWTHEHLPAGRSMEVIWNHGLGWRGVAYDTHPVDSLTPAEVELGLRTALGSEKLDVLGFDACLMAMTEVAYEVRNVARTMLGSEELECGSGWPYTDYLGQIEGEPAASTDHTLRALVTHFATAYAADAAFAETQSAPDLARAGALATATDSLAASLRRQLTVPGGFAAIRRARDASQIAMQMALSHGDATFVDLYDFADHLGRELPAVAGEAAAVRSELRAVVPPERTWHDDGPQLSYAGRTYPNDYFGLTVFFPPRGGLLPGYSTLTFANDTEWDEFLTEYERLVLLCGTLLGSLLSPLC